MSELLFTADEHHGHENIIKFCNRPFKNTTECTETIIAKHNAVVPKGARVYHLGDMFWRTLPLKAALDIIHNLNGQHYYIWGNHCELLEQNAILRSAFVWCKDLAQIKYKDLPKIVMCHYAMRVWNGSHRGAWHLYGHSHGELDEQGLSFDVGVDCNNFEPVSIEQVEAKMREKIALGITHPLAEKMAKQKLEK